MPASGTFSGKTERGRAAVLPALLGYRPLAEAPGQSRAGRLWYCAGLPIPRSSSSSRTSGLTAIEDVGVLGKEAFELDEGPLLRTGEVTL